MRTKIAYILTTVVLIVLICVIPPFITFNGNLFYEDSVLLAIYIVSKVLCGLCLIGITLYLLFRRVEYGSGFQLYLTTAIFQIVPLFTRLCLSYALGFEIMWSVIVICVSFLIYALLMLAIFWTSNKRTKSEQKYAGNSIPVYDEHDNFDENNHFTGIDR